MRKTTVLIALAAVAVSGGVGLTAVAANESFPASARPAPAADRRLTADQICELIISPVDCGSLDSLPADKRRALETNALAAADAARRPARPLSEQYSRPPDPSPELVSGEPSTVLRVKAADFTQSNGWIADTGALHDASDGDLPGTELALDVFAGHRTSDPQQGLLVVTNYGEQDWIYPPGELVQIPTPVRGGTATISATDKAMLTISLADGQKLTYNALTATFVK